MQIIVENREGKLFFCGASLGCWTKDGSMDNGKASGDARGWTIKFDYKEPVSAYFVSSLSAFTYTY
jgi:hypothetical protein